MQLNSEIMKTFGVNKPAQVLKHHAGLQLR